MLERDPLVRRFCHSCYRTPTSTCLRIVADARLLFRLSRQHPQHLYRRSGSPGRHHFNSTRSRHAGIHDHQYHHEILVDKTSALLPSTNLLLGVGLPSAGPSSWTSATVLLHLFIPVHSCPFLFILRATCSYSSSGANRLVLFFGLPVHTSCLYLLFIRQGAAS